jgi:hypothetical protein
MPTFRETKCISNNPDRVKFPNYARAELSMVNMSTLFVRDGINSGTRLKGVTHYAEELKNKSKN